MSRPDNDFVLYCCELLASLGRCSARRMFGGWGISVEGMNVALVADLGDGERLWLKADPQTQQSFEAAACARFTYSSQHRGKPVQRGLNYYAAPVDAMESAAVMSSWAGLALAAALRAQGAASGAGSKLKRRTMS